MVEVPPRLITCDEAGSTGPDVLSGSQPMFVYASHDLEPVESGSIIEALRSEFQIRQPPELKASGLRKRAQWPQIAARLAELVGDRALMIASDKRLSLAARIVNYFVKPAIASERDLLDEHDFYRLAMHLIHREIAGGDLDSKLRQLQRYLTHFQPEDAPVIFGEEALGAGPPAFTAALTIARAMPERVIQATEIYRREIDPTGIWTLDLALPSLHCLLFSGWGKRFDRLEVVCDESKPLKAFEARFNAWVGQSAVVEARAGRKVVNLKGEFGCPLRFESSSTNEGLQVADLIAGAAYDVLRAPDRSWPPTLQSWISATTHVDALLPERSGFDPGKQAAHVTMDVLREVARRARNDMPLAAGLAAFYEAAKRRRRSPAGRVGAPSVPKDGKGGR